MNEYMEELTCHILPYWMEKMIDHTNGGFYGRTDGNDILHPEANKGGILHARILWTFSAAYRLLRSPEYRTTAQLAFDYIESCFIDPEYGGAYWELDYLGNPVNTKKQTYLQGFMLYGYSEYFRASGDLRALQRAREFFRLIEQHKDNLYGGYFEAFTRDWHPIDDMRLSEKDANEKKSMNTHLHILEAYTNLLKVWRNEELIAAQKRLTDIFTDQILDPQTHHLHLFFDEAWNRKSSSISYGHDIEAAWLLHEAVEVAGDREREEKIKPIILHIAEAALEGLDTDGGLNYEQEGDHTDREKHWWVQCEAVVGFTTAFALSGESRYKEAAERIRQFIREHLSDRQHGEWYWSILPDGSINRREDKAGFWKGPYHNGRMCMERMC